MNNKVVTFDQDYLNIPLRDLPDTGNLIVCHDPKGRLNPQAASWAVVRALSDQGAAPPNALAIFWDKAMAIFFANALIDAEDNGTAPAESLWSAGLGANTTKEKKGKGTY